jgi:hypothetical protein
MANRRRGNWMNSPPDWMTLESQKLSPLTLVLLAAGPGLLALVAVQAKWGYWPAVVAFVVLEAGVLALIRRDYRRRKSAEDARASRIRSSGDGRP